MTEQALLRITIIFCVAAAVSTWMGTVNGGAAFVLGVAFGWRLMPGLLRWAEG